MPLGLKLLPADPRAAGDASKRTGKAEFLRSSQRGKFLLACNATYATKDEECEALGLVVARRASFANRTAISKQQRYRLCRTGGLGSSSDNRRELFLIEQAQ